MGTRIPPDDPKSTNLTDTDKTNRKDKGDLGQGTAQGIKSVASALLDMNPGEKVLSNVITALGSAGQTALGTKSTFGKVLKAFGDVGAGGLSLVDDLRKMQKGAIESSFAFEGFGKTLGSFDQIIDKFNDGLAETQKATGLGADEISKKHKELYATSTYLAGGFKAQMDAQTRLAASMNLLAETTIVARSTGVDFGEASNFMKEALINQGEAGEETTRTMALLNANVTGTGISTQAALGHIKSLSKTFEFLSFNSGEAADMIANVVKTQKELADSGVKAFASPQQAAQTYTNVLSKLATDQQSFGSALLYTSHQGGGLKDAFKFMMASPAEALKMQMAEVKKLAGGGKELLTMEEADKLGDRGRSDFMAQASIGMQLTGTKSPQEYSALIAQERGGGVGKKATDDSATRKSRTDEALNAIKVGDEKYYPKIMEQNQLQNKYLGQIGIHTAVMASSILKPEALAQAIRAVGGKSAETLEKLKNIKTGKAPTEATETTQAEAKSTEPKPAEKKGWLDSAKGFINKTIHGTPAESKTQTSPVSTIPTTTLELPPPEVKTYKPVQTTTKTLKEPEATTKTLTPSKETPSAAVSKAKTPQEAQAAYETELKNKQKSFKTDIGTMTFSGEVRPSDKQLSNQWQTFPSQDKVRATATKSSVGVYDLDKLEQEYKSSQASKVTAQKTVMTTKDKATSSTSSSGASSSSSSPTSSSSASTSSGGGQESMSTPTETYAKVNLSVNVNGKLLAQELIPHLRLEFAPLNTAGQQARKG